MEYQLCPSMLSCDFNRIGEQLQILEKQGIKWLHIDVMDGIFVPSISFGQPLIKSIRKESNLFFDVHLMIKEPIRYINDFVDCGSDSITIHLEACENAIDTVLEIKKQGKKVGVSIKPNTNTESLFPLLPYIDMVLIMTVEPGFGGQKYISECTEKIRAIKEEIDKKGLNTFIQVDGGINSETINTVIEAGATHIVAGSWVFKGNLEKSVNSALEEMNRCIDSLEK